MQSLLVCFLSVFILELLVKSVLLLLALNIFNVSSILNAVKISLLLELLCRVIGRLLKAPVNKILNIVRREESSAYLELFKLLLLLDVLVKFNKINFKLLLTVVRLLKSL